MANKSVLELAVGTGQWDAGLRKARQALDNFTQAQGGLTQALDKESQKMSQFVGMIGKIESTAKTAKGQMNDYKGTIEQLTMQYNRMTDAQKQTIGQDYLRAIDQLKQKYQAVNKEIQDMNQSLNQTRKIDTKEMSAGGLFSGDKFSGMLQVFGGNLMTKGAGMAVSFVSEIGDMVKQGIELAKAGEGVRLAFERLNQPGILDNLREATHGTVTDLELMKAAVKFNDFKLPLEELGTMLAFAQQKAKDTGQSVDYMVDSIVTGLGRKSLMILDNLGLSATEIRDKMKETGDMTKAVGEIIREQMQQAGDYVETAADRATQANVELTNAMTRLGETFQPLTDSATSMWTDIKIGALDLLNNAVKPLIKALKEAGALGVGARGGAGYENLGGDAKVNRLINRLGSGKTPGAYSIYTQQLAEFDRYINSKKFQIAAFGNDNSGVAQSAKTKLQTELEGALRMRAEYVRRANELYKKSSDPVKTENSIKGVKELRNELKKLEDQRKQAVIKGDNELVENLTKQINTLKQNITYLDPSAFKTTNGKTTAEKVVFDENKAMLSGVKTADTMPSVWSMLGDQGLRDMLGIGKKQTFDLGKDISTKWKLGKNGQLTDGEDAEQNEKNQANMIQGIETINTSLQSIFGGIEKLGFEIPQELNNIFGVIQTIVGIVSAIQTLSTVKLFGFFGGGIAHAANGFIGGNTFSGDQIPIMVNSGELILNKAQQGNLASQLSGGGLSQLQLEAIVTGEDLRFVINSNGRRTGRGEIVTTNFR